MLKFYNTLTKRKEVFRPIKKKEVTMYNCGPTVYDYAHIGNFKTYMMADILRRFLEWKGFKVNQVMNITDVGHMTEDDIADAQGEDKIEKRAREQKKTPEEISRFYTKAFLRDWKKLNMVEPFSRPKATEYIKEMIDIITQLIKTGNAYESNGSVYFHVPSFPDYGKLSGNTMERLKQGAGGRVEFNKDKRNQLDFALWVHNPKHLMQWDSPWGRGYPGWHVECSAMSMKLLGKTIDIHTGGEDNIFPHHDCEIAQSESANKKKFVKYWIHSRHLKVEGKKMSKSLGNFYRLDDLIEKGYSAVAVRYLLISAHYRTKLNLTEKSLKASEKTVKRIVEFTRSIADLDTKAEKDNKKIDSIIRQALEGFEKSMDDDLNTPDALSEVFGLMTKVNKEKDKGLISRNDASKVYGFMIDVDRVLGLGLKSLSLDSAIPDDVELMVKEREEYRKQKDYGSADRIRDKLKDMGYVIEDTPDGPKAKRI